MTTDQAGLGRHVTHADGSVTLRYAGAYLTLTFPQALELYRDLDAGDAVSNWASRHVFRTQIGEALRVENVDAATGRFIK